jgi:hypothetical protein
MSTRNSIFKAYGWLQCPSMLGKPKYKHQVHTILPAVYLCPPTLFFFRAFRRTWVLWTIYSFFIRSLSGKHYIKSSVHTISYSVMWQENTKFGLWGIKGLCGNASAHCLMSVIFVALCFSMDIFICFYSIFFHYVVISQK